MQKQLKEQSQRMNESIPIVQLNSIEADKKIKIRNLQELFKNRVAQSEEIQKSSVWQTKTSLLNKDKKISF
jgi:hypothetical protein